jgi:hypothetical protein
VHLNDFAVMIFTSPRFSTDVPSKETFQEVDGWDIDSTVVPSVDARMSLAKLPGRGHGRSPGHG